MEKISQFECTFWEDGKPTGTRSFRVVNYDSYEDILFGCVMNDICMRKYHMDYWWPMLNDHVFINRAHANSHICEYKIDLYDPWKKDKLIGTFYVEISTLSYAYPKGEDPTKLLLVENNEYKQRKVIEKKPPKEEHLTNWVKNETTAIRWFLMGLVHAGSLRALKGKMSKATYYRNLKLCREKGYIVGDKLVRKVFIKK